MHMAKTLMCSSNAKLLYQKPEASYDVMTRRNSPLQLLLDTILDTKQHHPRLLCSYFVRWLSGPLTIASHPLSQLAPDMRLHESPACTHACLLAARNSGHSSFDASLQLNLNLLHATSPHTIAIAAHASLHASCSLHTILPTAACMVPYFADGTCHDMYHGQHTHKYAMQHLLDVKCPSHVCASQPHSQACTLLHAASINIAWATHTCMQHSFAVVASCLPWSASIPAVHAACTHLLHHLPAPTNPLLGWRRCQRIASSPHQHSSLTAAAQPAQHSSGSPTV
jgi:hypothetical protein